jgi:hypothetical protein
VCAEGAVWRRLPRLLWEHPAVTRDLPQPHEAGCAVAGDDRSGLGLPTGEVAIHRQRAVVATQAEVLPG